MVDEFGCVQVDGIVIESAEPAGKFPLGGAVNVRINAVDVLAITELGEIVNVPAPEITLLGLTVNVKDCMAFGLTPFDAVIVITYV